MDSAQRCEFEAIEDHTFEAHYIDTRNGGRTMKFDAAHWEHMARILSGRLRQMDKRAKAANARADAAEAALRGLRRGTRADESQTVGSDASPTVIETALAPRPANPYAAGLSADKRP